MPSVAGALHPDFSKPDKIVAGKSKPKSWVQPFVGLVFKLDVKIAGFASLMTTSKIEK